MSTRGKTHGITYDLERDEHCSFYVRHFLIECASRAGIHLPAFDVWAIVERDDYAMYVILEPMGNDWPQFIYTCGCRHEGIPIEDMIDRALDVYVAKHAAPASHTQSS